MISGTSCCVAQLDSKLSAPVRPEGYVTMRCTESLELSPQQICYFSVCVKLYKGQGVLHHWQEQQHLMMIELCRIGAAWPGCFTHRLARSVVRIVGIFELYNWCEAILDVFGRRRRRARGWGRGRRWTSWETNASHRAKR